MRAGSSVDERGQANGPDVMKALATLAALALAACTTAPATSGPAIPPSLQRVLDD